jgi:hypothetical protein
MRRLLPALGAASLALALLPAGAAEPVRLYNGRDLTGWHVESGKLESWKANGEMISCVLPGGGYLATDKEYGDFELRLEYRIPPAGNTGVGIRFPRGGWPSTAGMEIQILDDADPRYKNLKPTHRNASIYTFVGPKVNPAKPPGEWNRLVIRCKGPLVVVELNGVETSRVNMDEHQEPGKGTIPLSKRPRKGLVGLQSHGDKVDFRNIEITEL